MGVKNHVKSRAITFTPRLESEALGAYATGDVAAVAVRERYLKRVRVEHDVTSRTHGSKRSGQPAGRRRLLNSKYRCSLYLELRRYVKTPAKPPAWQEVFNEWMQSADKPKALEAITQPVEDLEYLPWDRIKFKTPPDGMDHLRWWVALKLRRQFNRRHISLRAQDDAPFHYSLTDVLLRRCETIARRASGEIALPEIVTTRGERDRYVVNSLIEEAITSSQLEGASTSRRVAKQMIRTGRKPVTHGERMILNNYRAMMRIQESRNERLTPDFILEIHRMVTEGTLDDPADAGRIQSAEEVRIAVWGDGEQLLYRPPEASGLRERLEALCAFANGESDGALYIPPPLRAIIVHFMMGYDHYFVDGNGRTARALFYWSMLHEGYWLIEYVTISNILKNAPSQYAGSFLLTEDDEGDLTHFLLYHSKVLTRALDELNAYLARKAQEIRELERALDSTPGEFNHRQLALLERAIADPATEFTVTSHSNSHATTGETARQDLGDLERRGLLVRSKRSRAFVWSAASDLRARLAPAGASL